MRRFFIRVVACLTMCVAVSSSQPFAPDAYTVALYHFNESNGTSAGDSSGNNHHGTLIGGGSWVAGMWGNCIDLDGTNDHVQIPDTVDLDGMQTLTVEAWIYPENLSGNARVIVGKVGSPLRDWSYLLMTGNPSTGAQGLYFQIGTNSQAVGVQHNIALPLNQWTHVAGVYDGQAMYVLQNDAIVAQMSVAAGNVYASTGVLRIGTTVYANARFFDGKIEEVRISNIPRYVGSGLDSRVAGRGIGNDNRGGQAYASRQKWESENLAGAVRADEVPSEFALLQNYPNPFNAATTIEFVLPEVSEISLTLHNLLGEEVTTIAEGVMSAGVHRVNFDAGEIATGIYFYRLQAGERVMQKKMAVVR